MPDRGGSNYHPRRGAACAWTRVLGPDHVDLADSVDALANVLRRLGELDEALVLHGRSLRLRERGLGTEHPSVAGALDGLSLLLSYELGRHDEAAAYAERSLAIRAKIEGTSHHEYARTLTHVALIEWARGRQTQALALTLE